MANIKETVYLTRDNAIDLLLSADTPDIDYAGVTRVDLLDVACAWSVLSTTSPGALTWSVVAGGLRLVLKLGEEPIPVGTHKARVILYDATNTDGVVWGDIGLSVKAACPVGP